jgi:hypothetical protein
MVRPNESSAWLACFCPVEIFVLLLGLVQRAFCACGYQERPFQGTLFEVAAEGVANTSLSPLSSSACTDKFSRHLVVPLPGHAFKNNAHVGVFVKKVSGFFGCAGASRFGICTVPLRSVQCYLSNFNR